MFYSRDCLLFGLPDLFLYFPRKFYIRNIFDASTVLEKSAWKRQGWEPGADDPLSKKHDKIYVETAGAGPGNGPPPIKNE